MDAAAIEREALELSADERAALAHKLLLSLEDLSGPENDQAWMDEAARRAAEIDSGKTQLVSSDEVSRKARTLLK